MANRNRDNRFRPSDEDDLNYNLHHGRSSGNERDYPLSDADRERFGREDFTHDNDRSRYGRGRRDFDESESYRAYPRFNDTRPTQGSRQSGGRDWRDTFYPRGTMGESRDGFSGGGYTDDVSGSGMMNATRSNRGRGQTDYWEPHIDNAHAFFTGAHSNQVHERNMGFGGAGHAADHLYDNHRHDSEYLHWRHNQLSSHDRDYHNWRSEQARTYDTSYENWRRSRADTFAKEFSDWRSSQDSLGQTSDVGQPLRASTSGSTGPNDAASTGAAYGTDRTGHSLQASQGHRNPAAGTNPSASGVGVGSSGSPPPTSQTTSNSTPSTSR